ncbi:hypothetical protein ACFVT2_11770 [Streptomyces sp. NPDC058000]|uniref:hypothetical protein n=1 Tax=Streptomyces sp. NPDC058000 TaxID=3346299 RepID=UPI0036E00E46
MDTAALYRIFSVTDQGAVDGLTAWAAQGDSALLSWIGDNPPPDGPFSIHGNFLWKLNPLGTKYTIELATSGFLEVPGDSTVENTPLQVNPNGAQGKYGQWSFQLTTNFPNVLKSTPTEKLTALS